MATANHRYGRIRKGDFIPYGSMAGASDELRKAYTAFGVRHDEDWPELPVMELEGEVIDPENEAHKQTVARVVEAFLATIPRREAKVLRLRFGIDLDHEYTLEEVGVCLDVTRERVRQIEAKALRRGRHPEGRELLEPAIDFSTNYFYRRYPK